MRKGNAAGVTTMMIDLALITVADPKMAAALELIQQRREIGDTEEHAAGTGRGERLA